MNDIEIQYRIMTETDIPLVVPFYIEYYNADGDAWTPETVTKRIHQVLSRGDSLCLLAEHNSKAAGFAMGFFEVFYDLTAYNLVEILLAPEFQNQGYGTQFMQELERRVKELGGAMIQLASVNDAFHEHFYGKLQYKTCTNLVLKSKFL